MATRAAGVFRGLKRSERRSAIRELLKVTADRDIIGFGGGLTAPEMFPVEQLVEICQRVLADNPSRALQYGPTEGLSVLRDALARHLLTRGIECAPDDILITTGAQQGLDLLAEGFLTPAAPVVLEAPTYVGALQSFGAHRPAYRPVAMDADGMIPSELEAALRSRPRPALLYTIPTFQNPSGVTLSPARREELLRLCNELAVPLVEDDPYSELTYEGDPPRPLRALPGGESVIRVGTISKVIAPGLRVGYVVAPRVVRDQLVLLKQGRDLHTDSFAQSLVAEYLELGYLESHIADLRHAYDKRRRAMLDALRVRMPRGVTWTSPVGGMFLWVRLPEGAQASAILAGAIAGGVSFVPGSAFQVDGGGDNCLRLNFTSSTVEEIHRGVLILADVVAGHLEGAVA